MMKKLLFGLAFIGLITACSTDSYKITGSFEDAESGTVYLRKIEQTGPVDVDTAIIENGSFTFEGSVEHPELHLLYYEDNQAPVVFFLENANITIKAVTTDTENAEISGSRLSTLFQKFNDDVPHMEKVESMREEFFQAQNEGDQATMESIMADMEVIVEDQNQYYKDFVKDNSDNALGAFLALNMAQAMTMEELEEVVTELSNNLEDHPYVIQLKEMMAPMQAQQAMEESLNIGSEAPGFTLTDLDGNEVNLDDFRGKYVFVDFWAAWCRPCREENPVLKQAYDRFGGEQFEIVGVSLDEEEADWREAVEEDQINWTQLHDPTGVVAESYAVQSIPNTWLLDKDGNIMEKQIKGEELIETLEELLN
ncbi:TlpA disulfide reductase family protein [Marinilabiliaceae bacterium ANBcel2]|nr:TlpA disulfide reductase family protein [Marinilabiliaceae bacterium ANBcel2]